ncbi:zinc-finger homeodomain protein 6-like [Carya illinoinensis]|uniref:ZF-HD dimerization-type domain-containing protein n=2 Tax=Carya illinoinensis TaxID=32201 RepID=A0A922FZL1_CARIL|nr:zinc-finger homeodomain protein 6-like [Carya illinoinensis]KAG6729662.1 hypothetical protein I3842_01G041000 [Carya illinoinensis]
MELRGQDKEMGMPSTLSYDPSHRESTTNKLSSPLVASAVGERRRDQTVHGNTIVNPAQALDHHPVYHHHPPPPPPHQSDPHPHQDAHKPRRDPDPNPDPVPAQLAATGAISTPTRTGASTLKSPLPQPPRSISTIRAAPKVRYRECMKNHVASTGGHVVDGCGEFMSSGEEGTPEALQCAACECHRNFHRKEVEGDSKYVSNCYYPNPSINNGQREMIPSQHHPPLPPPSAHVYHHHQKFPHVLSTAPLTGATAPVMMAFGGGFGAAAESSSEDLNMFRSNVGMQTSVQAPQSKRRFRTKFTQEQKDKMMEFAEKLGWKIQKHDDQEVQQFCSEVGVKRKVFKVWMHNNKQALKKKQM